jgi:hypothetical protein
VCADLLAVQLAMPMPLPSLTEEAGVAGIVWSGRCGRRARVGSTLHRNRLPDYLHGGRLGDLLHEIRLGDFLHG